MCLAEVLLDGDIQGNALRLSHHVHRLLRFTGTKEQAAALMEAHKEWIRRGFDESVFVLVGSLRPEGSGGTLLACNTSLADLQSRVAEDPFVREGVVAAEILEVAPARTDPRLGFLAG